MGHLSLFFVFLVYLSLAAGQVQRKRRDTQPQEFCWTTSCQENVFLPMRKCPDYGKAKNRTLDVCPTGGKRDLCCTEKFAWEKEQVPVNVEKCEPWDNLRRGCGLQEEVGRYNCEKGDGERFECEGRTFNQLPAQKKEMSLTMEIEVRVTKN